jgi:hypothetical protein
VGLVVTEVSECLPSKDKALSSNPSTTKNNNNNKVTDVIQSCICSLHYCFTGQ